MPPGTTDESIWRSLLEELDWLYCQMNRSLRDCLAPVLALFEIKTIVLCLRNKTAQKANSIDRMLERSLLTDGVKRLLRAATDVSATIGALAGFLGASTDEPGALGRAYAEAGLRGFEDSLMRGYLTHVAQIRSHQAIRSFFASFIDLRNVMILYKHLRWEIEQAPAFISGGSIELSRFLEIANGRTTVGLETLVREITGGDSAPGAVTEGALETVLLRSLARELRDRGRAQEPVGVILDYVWRLYLQARNMALLFHGTELDAGTLERELIT